MHGGRRIWGRGWWRRQRRIARMSAIASQAQLTTGPGWCSFLPEEAQLEALPWCVICVSSRRDADLRYCFAFVSIKRAPVHDAATPSPRSPLAIIPTSVILTPCTFLAALRLRALPRARSSPHDLS
ncbi:hypothetical protein CC85DRAFT_181652 [Cutaneotrichosporon oleaginosum]|uniref:Uncharacterized protein n=1 Tax=Cutaneotrichosporon oleaginosum TaxID=879819 RepID=A0A0J0XF60_9TREE|nr:uncharacterized protein CC85DRAFT_181652 [Cutaneotrichosporon oleaginosum]KLT39688.1 hypothetical protein CC85DRAFT_181652 [Cutaneotrichosporon oleaginosum]TXT12404.1 hypothetical protein COLE_02814 [Cutaneotrichosporon oleaginosum]